MRLELDFGIYCKEDERALCWTVTAFQCSCCRGRVRELLLAGELWMLGFMGFAECHPS